MIQKKENLEMEGLLNSYAVGNLLGCDPSTKILK